MGFSSMLMVAPTHVCCDRTNNSTESEKKDVSDIKHGESISSNYSSHIPKGVVVALYVNLLDTGLSKSAEGIVEAFQQCANRG